MTKKREELVLEHVTKNQKGIEVGPWFSPLAPKQAGYNCLTLDVFDGPTLRQRAAVDPNVPKEKISAIEDVDLLGSSTEIAQLVSGKHELGTFDYIVSSHNFEHLPNPIKFLQGCAQVLKPGGLLSMAIPDRRACFDHYRPNSRLSEWIQAYFEDRRQPTLAQEFDQHVFFCPDWQGKSRPELSTNLKEAYESWRSRRDSRDVPYQDAHCWTFTPNSFEILIIEAGFLGLSPFVPLHISPTKGVEFFVHLRNSGYLGSSDLASKEFYERRQALFELTSAEPNVMEPEIKPEPSRKFRLWR